MKYQFTNKNKKSLEAISKANYLKDKIILNSSTIQQTNNNQIIKSGLLGSKGQKFYFIQEKEYELQSDLNLTNIEHIFQRIYSNNNSYKINDHSFVNHYKIESNSLFNSGFQFSQLIDIVIKQKSNLQGTEKSSSLSLIRTKSSSRHSIQISEPKFDKNYSVHIVHSGFSSQDSQNIKWQVFVETYDFINIKEINNDYEQENKYKIIYSMVFTYKDSEQNDQKQFNFLSLFESKKSNATSDFLLKYFDQQTGNQQRIKKLQSYLFHSSQTTQQIKSEKRLIKKLPCYNTQLKRQLKIPPQYFMQYKKLKQKMIDSYFTLNQKLIRKGQIQDFQMKIQNAICRFLLEHNYDFEKVNSLLSSLFQWEHKLRTNFTMKSFNYWIDQDFLIKIGFDRVGRPVFLFKAQNFLGKNCNNVSEYINFLFYLVLIQSLSKCLGYIDEIILLADCRNASMKNLHIQGHKKAITTALEYCPQMCFKVILFECSTLHYYCYKIFEPVLPSYANQIVKMYKEGNQNLALEQCLKYMDKDVIPEVIGGKNILCDETCQS